MIDFHVEPGSAAEVAQSFAAQKNWIIQGVLAGMAEAMEDLARATAEASPHRTGALQRAILGSPKVKETAKEITGTVSANVGRRHVGLWLESGIREPAVVAKRVKAMRLFGDGGEPVFIRSHRAFAIPARPFMNPTLQEQKAQIFETLRRHIAQAQGQK